MSIGRLRASSARLLVRRLYLWLSGSGLLDTRSLRLSGSGWRGLRSRLGGWAWPWRRAVRIRDARASGARAAARSVRARRAWSRPAIITPLAAATTTRTTAAALEPATASTLKPAAATTTLVTALTTALALQADLG